VISPSCPNQHLASSREAAAAWAPAVLIGLCCARLTADNNTTGRQSQSATRSSHDATNVKLCNIDTPHSSPLRARHRLDFLERARRVSLRGVQPLGQESLWSNQMSDGARQVPVGWGQRGRSNMEVRGPASMAFRGRGQGRGERTGDGGSGSSSSARRQLGEGAEEPRAWRGRVCVLDHGKGPRSKAFILEGNAASSQLKRAVGFKATEVEGQQRGEHSGQGAARSELGPSWA